MKYINTVMNLAQCSALLSYGHSLTVTQGEGGAGQVLAKWNAEALWVAVCPCRRAMYTEHWRQPSSSSYQTTDYNYIILTLMANLSNILHTHELLRLSVSKQRSSKYRPSVRLRTLERWHRSTDELVLK